jgi:glutaconate CoA-transferase subunit B
VVCSVGYNNDRLPRGYSFSDIDIRTVVTNLCVLDFNGPNKQMRVATLHPGVGLDEVQDNTGFDLAVADDMGETTMPSDEQLDLLSQLDPLNVRARQLKNNPAGIRQTVETQS